MPGRSGSGLAGQLRMSVGGNLKIGSARCTRHLIAGLAASALAGGCAAVATEPDTEGGAQPPGADVTVPFPIDRGDEGSNTPGTYKGLWLRLVDNGEPTVTAVDGIIGMVCIGMSNATQECSQYVTQIRDAWAGEINPQVRVVDCAVGGHAIELWNDPSYDDVLWDTCSNVKLQAAGIRLDQVRVIYHKAADQFTTGPGNTALPTYPAAGSDYANFLANLSTFATRAPVKFPSLQAVYTTSRSYGGFAGNQNARGEPLSYEEGHALNTSLRDHPRVQGVWYGWGPYIWAPECSVGVNGTGLCYVRSDYVDDGVHPSLTGRLKVARAIHDRLRQHAWYRR
jgi:hypothetical protein